VKHLIASTIAATVLLAPAQAADEPNGTQMLIDALLQVEQVKNLDIDRLPTRFVLTWEANINDIHDTTAISPAEHEARLEALQPVIQALIGATAAEPGPFDVSMLPQHQHNELFVGERRNAVRLLLADAERFMLAGSLEAATDRIIAAIGVIDVSFRDAHRGGFMSQSWDPHTGHMLAGMLLPMVRNTLCILVPVLPEENQERIAATLEQLEDHRAAAEESLPQIYTIELFQWATSYDAPLRSWRVHINLIPWRLWTAVCEDRPVHLQKIPLDFRDLARDHPLTRRLFWPGFGQMLESAKLDHDTAASLHRYAHALIRGESGTYGITVQHDARTLRSLAAYWFGLSDHIAAMQCLLSGHPKVPLDPIEREPTAFATFRAALNAYIQSAAGGSIEATKRAALFAVIIRDVAKYRDAEPGDEAERLAMLQDLKNFRPDDPLRFEANSRRVTERMYLDMHEQIETEWTTRERFRDLAPEWFAARGVPKAAAGVEHVLASIDLQDNFQNRLHELARGWLANEMRKLRRYDLRQLRYPADEASQRWEDDEIDEYLLHYRGPMAAYLSRDWVDDLAAVQEGTRALWELRALLEANHEKH